MPIYEYKCDNGHVFDVMQKMSDDPLKDCIECEAPVKKLMHPVNISFKGSGFYSTDYKGGKKQEKAAADKSGATEAGGGSETKPESNGAKKSESSSTEKKAAKKD